MTTALILTLSAAKLTATVIAPVAVVATLIARLAEPVDPDLW